MTWDGWQLVLQHLATAREGLELALSAHPVPPVGALVCYEAPTGRNVVFGTVVSVKYDYRLREVIVTLSASNR